jgi:hypothetical protein
MNHWYLGGSWRVNVGFILLRSEVARHNKPHDCWIAINKVLGEGEVLPTTPLKLIMDPNHGHIRLRKPC